MTIAALVSLAAAGLASGEPARPPETLVIGYKDEGKIDASREACVAHVKEVTEWSEAETQRGAREVCAARRKHIDAYAALQAKPTAPSLSRSPLIGGSTGMKGPTPCR